MTGHRLPDWEKHKEKMSTECSRLTKLKEYVRIRDGKSPQAILLWKKHICMFPTTVYPGVLRRSKDPWDPQFRKEGVNNSYEYFLAQFLQLHGSSNISPCLEVQRARSCKFGAYFSYQTVQSSHTRKLFSQEAESPQPLPFCSNQPPILLPQSFCPE